MRKTTTLAVVVALLALLPTSPAEAGKYRRAREAAACANGTCPTTAVPAQAAPAAGYTYSHSQQTTVTYAQAGTVHNPDAFAIWLNGVRANHGLGAVATDPDLAGWAAMNNSHQLSRGMGHYVMGPARRQNSGMGAFSTVCQMWMASPGHRAALLDPYIRFVGIAGTGVYWTFNAY